MVDSLKPLDSSPPISKQVAILLSLDFTPMQVLILLVCLSELDGAGYVKVPISEIADSIGIASTTVYTTLREAKMLGVTHHNKRYFFGNMIERLKTAEQTKENDNGLR
jgi:hypothetical protein